MNYYVNGPIEWTGAKYNRIGGKQVMVKDIDPELKNIKVRNALKITEGEADELIKKFESGDEVVLTNVQVRELHMFGVHFKKEESEEWRARRIQIEEQELKAEQDRMAEEARVKEITPEALAWFETLTEQQKEYVMKVLAPKFQPIVICGGVG